MWEQSISAWPRWDLGGFGYSIFLSNLRSDRGDEIRWQTTDREGKGVPGNYVHYNKKWLRLWNKMGEEKWKGWGHDGYEVR